MIMQISARQNGFTFIEIAITVAIVAMLATLVLPMAEVTVKRDREHDLRAALREIRTALDAYKRAVEEGRVSSEADKSGYPAQLKVLVEGVTDMKSPDGKAKIYFLRRIPRDPTYPDAAKAAEDTWGKRSYESSADAPQEGDDVYDVYSLSAGVGINGIPYKDW
jgi:general secretion pathway protein G